CDQTGVFQTSKWRRGSHAEESFLRIAILHCSRRASDGCSRKQSRCRKLMLRLRVRLSQDPPGVYNDKRIATWITSHRDLAVEGAHFTLAAKKQPRVAPIGVDSACPTDE